MCLQVYLLADSSNANLTILQCKSNCQNDNLYRKSIESLSNQSKFNQKAIFLSFTIGKDAAFRVEYLLECI